MKWVYSGILFLLFREIISIQPKPNDAASVTLRQAQGKSFRRHCSAEVATCLRQCRRIGKAKPMNNNQFPRTID